jgi:hypothetical protein
LTPQDFLPSCRVNMTKKTRNWLIVLAIMAFPFVLFLGFLVFMEGPVPPLTPLPNPNGYDDLVKADSMVTPLETNVDKMGGDELRKAVAANAAALALARTGLSKQCRVPVQYSESYISNHLDELAGIKRLARAFAAEGRWALLENRTNDAIQTFLDTIHLGNESAHGGVLIDELVGIAIESIGTSHLTNLVDHLDAGTCRETAASLEALDSQRQTWDEVMQQENAWSHGAFRGWSYELARLEERHSMNAIFADTRKKFNGRVQSTRQLIIVFAARAYELDKGHPPASAANLVPEYLKAVPQDPVTGTNMAYSPR